MFDTLEKAGGQSCQATNFLKTFSSLPEALRLNLLEEHSHAGSLTDMLQAACRFILGQTSADYKRIVNNTFGFEKIFGIDALASIRCTHCHNETIRPGGTFITELIYPALPSPNSRQARSQSLTSLPTFCQALKASIELQIQTRGWCDKCRRYQSLSTRKALRNVPQVFMLNAACKTAEAKRYWSEPGWLPDRIGVVVDSGKFFCLQGEDLRGHLRKGIHEITVYDLVGVVADIHSGENQKSHLVSLINGKCNRAMVTIA